MPGGSNLRMSQRQAGIIEGDHRRLFGKDAPLQHPLSSIYGEDGRDLGQILHDIETGDINLHWEHITNLEDGQNVVKFQTLRYNPLMDKLLVSLCGIDVYEGIDNQYLQSGEDEITFTFPLKSNYEIFVLIGGTISSETFGDSINSGLTRFTQLKDVPGSYAGQGGKALYISEDESGVAFKPSILLNRYDNFGSRVRVEQDNSFFGWFPFANNCIIKGIKVTGSENTGEFGLRIWTEDSKMEYVYDSYDPLNPNIKIIWDIMDIPYTDVSGFNAFYYELWNKGPVEDFYIQIYVLE